MGYEIHITRKEDQSDDESNEIKLTEWIDYVKRDEEMRLERYAAAKTGNEEEVSYENDGLAVWTSYSKSGRKGNYAWFDFRNGEVTVKNPDQEIINKMIDIAGYLKAKVQGDDGETYDNKEIIQEKKPWWKVWN
ncbi:hypothetical protein [Chryseolinea soli]|uniref:Uncharacterized protein n=1 Tax=Chryseolinea soli TaxID=2321403 RepID=A0A385SQJ3_9BACT|nr:hypothetical protein [Chryseolinea soli]AYB34063.1 hypothetical protein D4L85_27325 [Chryseolinea soli]